VGHAGISEGELLGYGRTLIGAHFAVPLGIARWRSPSAATRELRDLFRAAIRAAETRPDRRADVEAAHGLQQQIIDSMIQCLCPVWAREEAPAAKHHRDLLARFEDLLQARPLRPIPEICAKLRISERLLREYCRLGLGLSPSEYRRRRAMQQVHRALRSANPQATTVSEIAGQYGFHDLSHFAANYRAIYGELPSATLRLDWSRGVAELRLGRPRAKLS
jgi:AraC-like DNA-binding protein